ncbi:hypothetical protein KY290_010249 [Solanum tuberosum]|uniref:Uncharacterized protein n=1 Tax=Solanum tuberosum TaxID=4113 RepID=A0ABQ7VX93_SOLTU|nr:hypothetical protein KY289_010634 [Solanum tuberosum]KAH0773112.1 hypothetical protein KY290_010249 [Solanum tuberosum]
MGASLRFEVDRRLSLNSPPTTTEIHESSDLENCDDGKMFDTNGTVPTVAEDETLHSIEAEGINRDQNKGNERIEEQQKPWVNMFRNNRATNNGMNLSYIPPQIVNGQTMVQLEEKEVQVEEDKCKCALIAYAIVEYPGYNTMNMYISLNWTAVAKPDVYLHEEGYYIV